MPVSECGARVRGCRDLDFSLCHPCGLYNGSGSNLENLCFFNAGLIHNTECCVGCLHLCFRPVKVLQYLTLGCAGSSHPIALPRDQRPRERPQPLHRRRRSRCQVHPRTERNFPLSHGILFRNCGVVLTKRGAFLYRQRGFLYEYTLLLLGEVLTSGMAFSGGSEKR